MVELVKSGDKSELQLKLATIKGLVKAIEDAPPWQKIDAASKALAVAFEFCSLLVDRVERLEVNSGR